MSGGHQKIISLKIAQFYVFKKILRKSCSPSIIPTNTPHSNRMNWLWIQNRQVLWIDKFESTFVQVQKQVFTLH